MILPFDINEYIKDHPSITAVLAAYNLTDLPIVPLNESEPCADGNLMGTTFLRYFWMPGVMSNQQYFIREDRIRYYVMDRDFDRMWAFGNALVRLFDTQTIPTPPIPCSTGENFIKNYHVTNSNSLAPKTVGGLGEFMVEIEVIYVSPPVTP